VVVQSQAIPLVFSAASITRLAHIFSNLSSRVISFAIVTQSLVSNGHQYSLSRATFLHFGHIVTITVFATVSIHANILDLASSAYFISFDIFFI